MSNQITKGLQQSGRVIRGRLGIVSRFQNASKINIIDAAQGKVLSG
jgi:hypothetical protein